jgi:mRNA interferase RelE/StbE
VRYEIQYLPEATAALEKMSPDVARRIVGKIGGLQNDLAGNVKRLRKYFPNYRLRVGDWRVLFEVRGSVVVIHQVLHRSKAYERD